MIINKEMSMVEVAELLIQRKNKPQKFKTIAKEVCEILGLTDDEFELKLVQLYTDLTLSGKFVTVGEDKWDLKSRQKYDVANYDTCDIDFEDGEVESFIEEDFDVYSEDNEDSLEEEKEDLDQFEGLMIYSEDDLE